MGLPPFEPPLSSLWGWKGRSHGLLTSSISAKEMGTSALTGKVQQVQCLGEDSNGPRESRLRGELDSDDSSGGIRTGAWK